MFKKFLVFNLIYFLSINVFSREQECKLYLSGSTEKVIFRDQIQDKFISLQVELHEEQEVLIQSALLFLKERSLKPNPKVKDFSVPVVLEKTYSAIGRWSLIDIDSLKKEKFLNEISDDPYLKWLEKKSNKKSSFQVKEYFWKYQNTAWEFKLNPQLLIFKIIHDFDPSISRPFKSHLHKILYFEKVLYHLNQEILKLADDEYGDTYLWQQIGSLKSAIREYLVLRKTVIKTFSNFTSLSEYNYKSLREEIPEELSYEEYLLQVHGLQSKKSNEQDLYLKYFILKNMIRLIQSSSSLDYLMHDFIISS